MKAIPLENLKEIPYLNIKELRGRSPIILPYWDGYQWHSWLYEGSKLINMKTIEYLDGWYFSEKSAKNTDIEIKFITFLWQRAGYKQICHSIEAMSNNILSIATSASKMRHFHNTRHVIENIAHRYISTELEYVLILNRSIFDIMQEIVAYIWNNQIKINDKSKEELRKRIHLPTVFSKIVLRDKKEIRSTDEIIEKYGIPFEMASTYWEMAHFFSEIRDARDSIVHGGYKINMIFETEKGYCVNPAIRPFMNFVKWKKEDYYNKNLVSLMPWVASVVNQTMEACNSMITALDSLIVFLPEIAPNMKVFYRGKSAISLMELQEIHKGASPWWM
jgi:hypothetical protein